MLEKVDYGGKGMTDKQLIDTLWNIRKECKKHRECNKSVFEKTIDGNNCQLMKLLEILNEDAPYRWNMGEIERIIKYE